MNILIDNKDLKDYFGINVLDYTGAFSFPAERENERIWYDKSGVDKNLVNTRYEAKEFSLSCYVKAATEAEAYGLVDILVEYMRVKKVVVLSFRDTSRNIRECFLCERSKVINPNINIRSQNSLYVFKLGFKDVNPNAIKEKVDIVGGSVTINYSKGQTASIFWGNGDNGLVENSGNYTKNDYAGDGPVDIIIDIDQDAEEVVQLVAAFSGLPTNVVKIGDVQFTDESTGDISVRSWIISKDGVVKHTSAEQDPLITFDEEGVYDVTLQVFNEVAGSDTETKIGYITVRNARMLVSDAGDFALVSDAGDYGLIN
jgi:PKD repeat protein